MISGACCRKTQQVGREIIGKNPE
ncbi:unnamed protein product, partial [Rotaria magnacalcarata]